MEGGGFAVVVDTSAFFFATCSGSRGVPTTCYSALIVLHKSGRRAYENARLLYLEAIEVEHSRDWQIWNLTPLG